MKRLRQPWIWCVLIGLIVVSLIWAAYRFSWPGTGFQGKTAWDWLSLLIIPFVLALVALFFNQINTRTERQIASQRYEQDQKIASQRYEQDQKIALDKQREDLLQAYLDRMSELLLEKGLRTSQPDAEVRKVAQMRTISVLIQLDARRVGYIFAFLREAGLTDTSSPIISLKDANLSGMKWEGANLSGANLRGANLRGANLSEADLSGADLDGANLSGANLSEADLRRAYLDGAYLNGAYLNGADLRGADLREANLSEADLRRADLREADLSEADLRGADLRGADLNGADLNGADLNGADLT